MTIIRPEQPHTAIYRRLSESLRDTIARNAWPTGTQLPNVKKIAAASGVSLRTADLAVRELVKAGICYRRPKQGTFVARPLSDCDGRKRVVLMHSVFTCHDFSGSTIQMGHLDGLQRITSEHGVTMIPIYGDLLPQLEFYHESTEVRLLGVVFTDSLNLTEKTAALCRYPELPFALVNYRIEELSGRYPNLIEVYSDEAGGGAWAAEYLWSRGHRKFALINFSSGSGDCNYNLRLNGFCRRLSELGGTGADIVRYNAQPDEIGSTPSQRLLHSGAEIYQHLRRHSDEFTALFCVEDAVAAGAAVAAREHRIEVVGYDRALPCISDMARIPSVAVDYLGMTYRAGRLLLENAVGMAPTVLPVTPHLPERD